MIVVDTVRDHGWVLSGKAVKSCHLFSSTHDRKELMDFAVSIGLSPRWLQFGGRHRVPHFDLTEARWRAAIRKGAVPVSDMDAVTIWQDYEVRQRDKGMELIRVYKRECVEANSKQPEVWFADLTDEEREQVFVAMRNLASVWVKRFDNMKAWLDEAYIPAFREFIKSIELS